MRPKFCKKKNLAIQDANKYHCVSNYNYLLNLELLRELEVGSLAMWQRGTGSLLTTQLKWQ